MKILSFTALFLSLICSAETLAPPSIGSKAFTEGYLLGELLAQKIEANFHLRVNRRFGMGNTGVLFEALERQDIQLYVEYTGTIAEAILKRPELHAFEDIQNALKPMHLVMSAPLGFNNTYALAVSPDFAKKYGLQKMSDLQKVLPQIHSGFSHEFMARADGFNAMAEKYNLHFGDKPQSMEHALSYEAIANSAVNLIDVYSTDAKIEKLNLVVLEDDLHFFPVYQAVILAREEFISARPEVWKTLLTLQNSIDEKTMRKLNAEVDLQKKSFQETIRSYLRANAVAGSPSAAPSASEASAVTTGIHWGRITTRTHEHLFLVGIALLFSILAGLPLGIIANRYQTLGQSILLLSGLVQTIPSLALLCFLIPFFGIGVGSALIALCLYGLLPVVMNTFVGLRSIDPALLDMSRALGLTSWQMLTRIQLPLASRNILAGIRTSAVIGIGTATLAALIGAGGYGATIVAGLAMNDTNLILYGAIPAAVMALLAHALFEMLNRWLIPKGLR